MMKPTLKKILAVFDLNHLNDPSREPYVLNIVGVRTADDSGNSFNDWLCFFRNLEGAESDFYAFPATTDPGIYWRQNPENVDGVAIVVPGQYPGLWALGKHKGYDALVQVGPIDVWRDNDRNNQLTTSKVDHGLFGINLHHASALHRSSQVDKWSAGCQVIANPNDFDIVVKLAHEQVQKTPERTFGYTLLEEQDINSVNA